MSKRKNNAKIFSLRIFNVFPKDDPIAINILRLMFGCNDTYLIEEWANGTKSNSYEHSSPNRRNRKKYSATPSALLVLDRIVRGT